MRIGILPLGRPTFDVDYAERKLASMVNCLEQTGHEIFGPRGLLFDPTATRQAIISLQDSAIDHLLLLQATFTDASMTVEAANAFDQPMSIWAVKEPRDGGRLRLNSFCGLNLASHALSLNGLAFSWLYDDPGDAVIPKLEALLEGRRPVTRLDPFDAQEFADQEGQRIAETLKGKRVARLGEHPLGFDTCAYSAREVTELTGVTIDALNLDGLFAAARAAPVKSVAAASAIAASALEGLEDVDQTELDRSLRLKAGLDTIRDEGKYDAFAIRCWPETFTEYGGAVCGPAGMLGEEGVPCACEADVYGALTQMVLQQAANAPVFLTDLVDMDVDDDTGVVWHCGQAPISMRDPEMTATATIHSNRKMPLLYQFPLKPGPVTFLRVSKSFNQPKLVLGFGEMLKRPMAFTGTSGVVRFERGTAKVLDDVIATGLEHHLALAYGDHRTVLRSVAAALRLPLLEI